MNAIDIWNPTTYPAWAIAILAENREGLIAYHCREIALVKEEVDTEIELISLKNGLSDIRRDLIEKEVMPKLPKEVLRGWHYTRLLSFEIEIIRASGVKVMSVGLFKSKLDQMVACGHFSSSEAKTLYSDSPIHDASQSNGRHGKFWMTSTPLAPADPGVKSLLEYWGGEVTYFWQKSDELKGKLRALGDPTVIEIRIPIEMTNHAYGVATSMVDNFARVEIGLKANAIDFYSASELGTEMIWDFHVPNNGFVTGIMETVS